MNTFLSSLCFGPVRDLGVPARHACDLRHAPSAAALRAGTWGVLPHHVLPLLLRLIAS